MQYIFMKLVSVNMGDFDLVHTPVYLGFDHVTLFYVRDVTEPDNSLYLNTFVIFINIYIFYCVYIWKLLLISNMRLRHSW